ncbi:MAG TPA: DUF1153 domain-containing protein [Allosphingosinicella sp.]|jgi:hypothetical protein|nr:DUF1153 domain-containing protein [Allosphingosinicella sp.]
MADRRNSPRPAPARPSPTFDIPPRATRRWVARRKAQVVEAVLGGMLRLDEALRRYELSIEEFSLWKRRFHRSGVDGLRMSPRLRHD